MNNFGVYQGKANLTVLFSPSSVIAYCTLSIVSGPELIPAILGQRWSEPLDQSPGVYFRKQVYCKVWVCQPGNERGSGLSILEREITSTLSQLLWHLGEHNLVGSRFPSKTQLISVCLLSSLSQKCCFVSSFIQSDHTKVYCIHFENNCSVFLN